MRWSLKVARLAGIDVRVHVTFLLLLAWVAFVEYTARNTVNAALVGVLFILAVFVTVVLHELGHSLVAKRYGVQTREIILLPIGGVSRLDRIPEDPRREFWIAIAGPLVSLGVAALLFLMYQGFLANPDPGDAWVVSGQFVYRLMWVNVALALFNLLPAFPMDGGRVLRSLLATRMPYAKATHHAARIGQGLAIALGLAGLFMSPLLIFIAVFVWLGATQEGAEAQIRSGLEGIPARSAMVIDFRTIAPGEPLSRVTQLVLAGAQEDFPVIEEGRLVGVITRRGLLRALAEGGADQSVASAMDRDFETADPSEMLGDVLPRLRVRECQTVPVVRDGQVLGLITPENISDFISIQAAEAAARQRPRPRHAV